MPAEIQILHLEDSDADAELIAMTLRRHGLEYRIERVQTRDAYLAHLENGGAELILSDFSLPTFDGLSALELARTKRPEIPFIFVTGTLGEDVAITALRSGASDYVFKHRLLRLGPAVERALADAAKRQELQRAEKAMIQSEHKYRQLFECMSEAALLSDKATGRVIDTNRQAEALFARPRAQILGKNVEHFLPAGTWREYRRLLMEPAMPPERVVFDGEILCESAPIPVTVSAAPIVLYERQLILALYRDVTEKKESEEVIRELQEQLSACQGADTAAVTR